MCGVDLTRIDGIDVTTALVVVSEIGTDMSRFPTDKHFASWLGLCPGTKISGGKVMGARLTKRCQPGGTGAAAGGCGAAHQPVGAGRVLPPAVRPHGQTQGGDGGGAQAGAADLQRC
jgi:hypothetical protein